jgi:hypothetical protein
MMIQVELPENEAWALAEFLKRAGLSDYRVLAASEDEAYAMFDAGEKMRRALAERGIEPR